MVEPILKVFKCSSIGNDYCVQFILLFICTLLKFIKNALPCSSVYYIINRDNTFG